MRNIFALLIVCSHSVQLLSGISDPKCAEAWKDYEYDPGYVGLTISREENTKDWPNNLKSLKGEEDLASKEYIDIHNVCLENGDSKCAEAWKAHDKLVLKHVQRLKAQVGYTEVLVTKKSKRAAELLRKGEEGTAINAHEDLYNTENELKELKKILKKTLDDWCGRYKTCKWVFEDPELCKALRNLATNCPNKISTETLKSLKGEKEFASKRYNDLNYVCLENEDLKCEGACNAYDVYVQKHVEWLESYIEYMEGIVVENNNTLYYYLKKGHEGRSLHANQVLYDNQMKSAGLKRSLSKTLNDWCSRYKQCIEAETTTIQETTIHDVI